jgi:aromatic ring hydroxylase
MVRNASEYVAGLDDDRVVWLGADKVKVTECETFAGSVAGMAGYFDWQIRHAGECLVDNPATGGVTNASLLIPRGPDDIARRHRAFDRLARYSYGMLGRTPDYVNVTLAGFAARDDGFVVDGDRRYADRLLAYHRAVAERDLSLTHAIVHPSIDKGISDTEGLNLELATRVVRRTKDHIVVRGAKVLATLAPFSDDIFVYPSAPLPADAPPEMALCFSIPVATKGLHVVCRDHFGVAGPLADRPFSSRFDEQDAFIIFDDVEVPNERVFIDGSIEAYNNCPKNAWLSNILQQTSIRAAVKLEFAFDLCSAIARVTNVEKKAEVQTMLGELRTYGNLTRAAIDAAEANAHEQGNGAFFPNQAPLRAIKNIMPSWILRANAIITALGSHNLLCTPTTAAFKNAELGPLVDRYVTGANGITAKERSQIFRAAWDFAGSALGARVALYEQFYLTSQTRNFAREAATASREKREDLFASFLGELQGVSPDRSPRTSTGEHRAAV